jgi:hypothetical protein
VSAPAPASLAARPGLLYSADAEGPLVRTTAFDVSAFTYDSLGDRRDTVDWDAFRRVPLSAQALRAVAYLWDVERSTLPLVRNVLSGYTHNESRITAFLTTWAYEKYWSAATLQEILSVHGRPVTGPVRADGDAAARAEALAFALRPISDSVWTTLVGEPVAALDVAKLASLERAGIAADDGVMTNDPHPALVAALRPLRDRKQLYAEFFELETRMRVTEDPVALRLVTGLSVFGWNPLRPTGVSRDEFCWFVKYALAGREPERFAAAIDHFFTTVPGLGSVAPMASSLRRERRRAARIH